MFKKALFLIILLILVALSLVWVFDYTSKNEVGDGVNSDKDVGEVVHKVALFADSHTSYDNLQRAIDLSKSHEVDYIIHTGDLSDFGETESYINSKDVLDNSGIEYAVLPGDRDMVENGTNFDRHFTNKLCGTKTLYGVTITCLKNPYNYTLLSQDYIDMFRQAVTNSDIVVASQPIYNPNSNIYMGYYDSKVREQADLLLETILSSQVKTFISGDAHFFSTYKGPQDSGITFYTLGALASERNLESPNFAIVYIYDTGDVQVKQVLLD